MQDLGFTEADWKLFRKRLPIWQERYMEKLIEEKCGVKMQTKIQKSDSNLEGTCVFDISSNGKYFTVDNKRKT